MGENSSGFTNQHFPQGGAFSGDLLDQSQSLWGAVLLFIPLFMDIHNSFLDIQNSFLDIQNSFLDIHNSFLDIHNSFLDIIKLIYGYP